MYNKNLDFYLFGHTGKYENDLKRVSEGKSTEVYSYVELLRKKFLRIMKNGENASSQVFLHKLLQSKGVNVPNVEGYEDFSSFLEDRSAMIVDDIGGISLEDSKLTLEDIKSILFHAGVDLAKINSIQTDGFGEIDMSGIDSVKLSVILGESYIDYISNSRRKLENLKNFFSQDIYNKLHTIIGKDMNLGDDFCLSHGDFDLSHIYVDKGQYTGIIDFGDIGSRSIYYDLAKFLLYSGKEKFYMLLEGYLSQKKLPGNYLNKIIFEALLIYINKISKGKSKNKFQRGLNDIIEIYEETCKK